MFAPHSIWCLKQDLTRRCDSCGVPRARHSRMAWTGPLPRGAVRPLAGCQSGVFLHRQDPSRLLQVSDQVKH